MIAHVNNKSNFEEFKTLMKRVDLYLNNDAKNRPSYYRSRVGNLLEDDVKRALSECAINTPFEGTVQKISGQRFPDIVVGGCFGVEVKSTQQDHWKSTGSSILETTRIKSVESIYMTFGKLGGSPIKFLSKPYEECLYEIAVTHMPRYLINMRLEEGDTIFDKIGISYDALRKMDNPIAPVSRYYRNQLKEGESLWWTGDTLEESVSVKIRIWKTLSSEEKLYCTIFGCVNYPEVFRGNYDRYALWLTSQGIVDHHIRDQFSSGGQETVLLSDGRKVKLPGIYRRILSHKELVQELLYKKDSSMIYDQKQVDYFSNRASLLSWFDRVSRETPIDYETSIEVLKTYFFK
jgi:hypothetical protein